MTIDTLTRLSSGAAVVPIRSSTPAVRLEVRGMLVTDRSVAL
jgi:hypothetical protein